MERIDVVRERIKQWKLDAAIVFNPENSYYVTGYRGSRGTVILVIFRDPKIEPIALIAPLQEKEVKESCPLQNVQIFPHRKGGRIELLAKVLNDAGLGNGVIGVEEKYHSFDAYGGIKAAMPKATLRDCSFLFEQLRAVKTKEEIEFIKVAYKVAKAGEVAVGNALKEGISEIELNQIGSKAKLAEAEKYPGFQIQGGVNITVAGASRTAQPPHQSSSNRVKAGDPVIYISTASCNSYCAEAERTFLVGNVSKELKSLFDSATETQKKAIGSIRPGIKASEVDRVARDATTEAGYGKHIYHFTGHGIGLGSNEIPILEEGDETLLEPGMVLCVEPGIYVPGLGGVRHSTTVLVTDKKDGHEIL